MSRVDAPGRKWSVLVVDDDPGLQGLFTTLLGRDGFAVDCAPNGRQAFEYLKRGSYSVILLDLMMPDVNGFDVVEALKAQPDTARIPVVIVTAKHITTEDRARLNGYVSSIMEKASFDPEGFTAEVRRAMSGRRLVA